MPTHSYNSFTMIKWLLARKPENIWKKLNILPCPKYTYQSRSDQKLKFCSTPNNLVTD